MLYEITDLYEHLLLTSALHYDFVDAVGLILSIVFFASFLQVL